VDGGGVGAESADSDVHALGVALARRERWSSMLSHGEAQCCAVARVLFHSPHLAVLDESLSGVDATVQARLLAALAAAGTAVLMASHRRGVTEQAAVAVPVVTTVM
jgi:ABC-type uncharacterized transport system fused permease/ATPase subunit